MVYSGFVRPFLLKTSTYCCWNKVDNSKKPEPKKELHTKPKQWADAKKFHSSGDNHRVR